MNIVLLGFICTDIFGPHTMRVKLSSLRAASKLPIPANYGTVIHTAPTPHIINSEPNKVGLRSTTRRRW
jgi:hypothetical protein